MVQAECLNTIQITVCLRRVKVDSEHYNYLLSECWRFMSASFLKLLKSMDIVKKKFLMSRIKDCSGRRHPTQLLSQLAKTIQGQTNSSSGRQRYGLFHSKTNTCLPLKKPNELKGFLKSMITMVLKSNKKSWFSS